jgi:hypothetical protein
MRIMKIITGKTGTNHVASEDDRGLHMGIIGEDNYVLTVGDLFKLTMIDANTARISSGELVINGCHARIAQGDYDDLIIDSGTTGYNRKDLIVARYTKMGDIEDVNLEVIKGAVSTGEATAPSYTSGSIYEGDTIVDMPLYEISISGINVDTIKTLYVQLTTNMSNIYNKNQVDSMISSLETTCKNLETAYKKADSDLDAKYKNACDNLSGEIASVSTNLTKGYQNADSDLETAYKNADANLESEISALSTLIANLETQVDKLSK